MTSMKTYLMLIPIVLLLDLIWLGLIMKGFYAREIGALTRQNGQNLAPRLDAALFVYLLIPAGVVLFVRPLLGDNASAWHAFAWGALFGLVLYGVYDLTNLAVLDKWTYLVSMVDIAWGCVLCGSTSLAMRFIERS